MDEQRPSGEQTHNGAGLTDASRWHGPLRDEHDGRGPGAPVPGADPATSAARGVVRADSEPAWRPAPGLDDDTPPGGSPAVEPPLWREAARRAPTSPGPVRWEPGERRWDRQPPPSYRGYHAAPAAPPPAAPPPAAPPPAAPPPLAPPPLAPPPVAPPGEHAGLTATAAPRPPGPAEPAAEPPAPGHTQGGLPQRIPAEPDVPDVGETPDPAVAAEAPELARIATRLRRDDVPRDLPTDGFDVDAVLAAVRDVPGVREASVRPSGTGGHTLRLDLSENADPVQVSRVVARMLQDRMGLSAAPRYVPRARSSPEGHGAGAATAVAAGAAAGTGAAGGQSGSDPPTFDPQSQSQSQSQSRPQPLPVTRTGPRVVIDHVQVNVVGMHATVEVQLAAGHRRALGLASGPAIDSYLVRLAAVSAAKAVDELMGQPPPGDRPNRCFVEHTGVVPFGSTEVAVVVVMLVCGGWVEQLAGSAVVDGDARHAAVRATLGAVNRRLDALLAD